MSYRKKEKSLPLEIEKWYLDACVLDRDKNIYGDILTRVPKQVFISHLALGEAFGNCHKKGEDALKSFVELIGKLKTLSSVRVMVVGHDNIDEELAEVKATFPVLKTSDAIHLATALKEGCYKFRTIDPDFKLEKKKVMELGKKFGINNFAITDVIKRK